MAFTFAKKAAEAAPSAQSQQASTPPKTPAQSSKSDNPSSFLMKGQKAKAALAEAEAQAELAAQEKGKLWPFWIEEQGTRSITFLDGDLDADNMLDINMVKEHSVKVNGQWNDFLCTADIDESQPCPLCTAGDKPNLVGVMTVIDHTPHKIQKGQNAGKTIQHQKKLFKCKRHTITDLTKLAVKRGGLRYTTWDAMRGDEKTARVGKQFDFTEKFASKEEFLAKYGLEPELGDAADYSQELTYRTPEELLELGVGKAVSGPGTGSKIDKQAVKNQL